MNPEKTVAELAESGGSSFVLGCLDDGVKWIRRVVIPKIQAGGFFTGETIATLSVVVSSIEFSIDHLKDLLTSTAISGLATEVGDLKDGQAKLNAKVNVQGKLMNKRMGDLKSDLEGQLQQQGEQFDQEIKNLDTKIAKATGQFKKDLENEKKQRQAQYQELKSSITEVTNNLNRVESKLTEALQDFKSEVNERFE